MVVVVLLGRGSSRHGSRLARPCPWRRSPWVLVILFMLVLRCCFQGCLKCRELVVLEKVDFSRFPVLRVVSGRSIRVECVLTSCSEAWDHCSRSCVSRYRERGLL